MIFFVDLLQIKVQVNLYQLFSHQIIVLPMKLTAQQSFYLDTCSACISSNYARQPAFNNIYIFLSFHLCYFVSFVANVMNAFIPVEILA